MAFVSIGAEEMPGLQAGWGLLKQSLKKKVEIETALSRSMHRQLKLEERELNCNKHRDEKV
jgi:hypothetical protein